MGRTKPVAQQEPTVDGSASSESTGVKPGESHFTADEVPPEKAASHLSAALLKAQRSVKAVGKEGTNKFHNYNYATSEDVIDEGRIALNSAGLTLSLAAVSTELFTYETAPSAKKKKNYGRRDEEDAVEAEPKVVVKNGLKITGRFMLLHSSGEATDFHREWIGIEESGRPLDKTLAGSLTTMLAYAIRDLLLVPRSDRIADMDRRDDRDYNAERERDRDRDRGEPEPEPERAAPAKEERREEKREPVKEERQEAPREEPKREPKKGYEKEEQPYASEDVPGFGLTEKAWRFCLDQVIANTSWKKLEVENDFQQLGESEQKAMGFLYDARGAKDANEFGKISLNARKAELPAEVDEALKKGLREVWDEIKKGL